MDCIRNNKDICYPPKVFRAEDTSNNGSNWLSSIDDIAKFSNFILRLNSLDLNFNNNRPHLSLKYLLNEIYIEVKENKEPKFYKRIKPLHKSECPNYEVKTCSETLDSFDCDSLCQIKSLKIEARNCNYLYNDEKGNQKYFSNSIFRINCVPEFIINNIHVYWHSVHYLKNVIKLFEKNYLSEVGNKSATLNYLIRIALSNDKSNRKELIYTNIDSQYNNTNWKKVSSELNHNYKNGLKVANIYHNEINHDLNTINRQSEINKNQLEKIIYKNNFLRITIIYLCILILLGFTINTIIPSTIVYIISCLLIFAWVIHFLISLKTYSYRHPLSHQTILYSKNIHDLENNTKKYKNEKRCNKDVSSSDSKKYNEKCKRSII
tara:strand:+ start:1350 stop:2483 length:1134 start_codon:yes stop_codon:yes gene_type:complete